MTTTERLILRNWRESDLEPWAAMNADPQVREFLGPVMTVDEAAGSIRSFQEGLDTHGYGFWAVEVAATGEFIGFTGLDDVDEGMPFTGIEVGWRLSRTAWGHGYATEAARAALGYGFTTAGLDEILALTTVTNLRSQAVMQRLGMTRSLEFDHPFEPDGPLRRHLLYRIAKP